MDVVLYDSDDQIVDLHVPHHILPHDIYAVTLIEADPLIPINTRVSLQEVIEEVELGLRLPQSHHVIHDLEVGEPYLTLIDVLSEDPNPTLEGLEDADSDGVEEHQHLRGELCKL